MMPVTTPQSPYYTTGYTLNGSYGEPLTITYDLNSSASSQPFVMVPATPIAVASPLKDDSPLTWLREQVEEIAELARAA